MLERYLLRNKSHYFEHFQFFPLKTFPITKSNMGSHCINSHFKPQTDQKDLLYQLKGTFFCNQLKSLHLIIPFLPRNNLKSLFTTICFTISRITKMTSWGPGILKDFSSVARGQYGCKTNTHKPTEILMTRMWSLHSSFIKPRFIYYSCYRGTWFYCK